MQKYKYINAIPEGAVFEQGDEIRIRKGSQGAYRWEDWKVASDGSLYPASLKEDEWLKLDQLTQVQIAKLTGLKTQTEISQDIQSSKNYTDEKVKQTVAETIPVTGTVLPRGADVPHYITTNGKAELFGGVGGTTYTNTGRPAPNNIFVIESGKLAPAFYNKTDDTWSLGQSVPLPVTPADGIIADGNNNAISGNEAFRKTVLKSSIKNNSLIASDSIYIINHTVINSLGGVLTNAAQYTNAKSIVGFPLKPNTTYTIGKFLASNGKNFGLSDASGNVVQAANLAILPKTFTTDATHTFLRCCVKQADNVEPTDTNWINTFMLTEGSVLPSKAAIRELEGSVLEAATLSAENLTPTPVTPNNAVNLDYFNNNSLKKSDLVLKFGSNLARQVLNETMIPHKFVNNLGGISAGMYWMMYAFYPLKYGLIAGDSFVVHGFTITGGGYAAWYEGAVMRTYEGAINGLTPKVYNVPVDATINTVCYFDIARPTDTGENYAHLTINAGSVAIPYVEPVISIKTLNGYIVDPGKSVTSFEELTDVPPYAGNAGKVIMVNETEDGLQVGDPSNNNGGDVLYNSVTTNFLVIPNRPIWDEISPTDLVRGQEYLFPDGNGNYFNKFKG